MNINHFAVHPFSGKPNKMPYIWLFDNEKPSEANHMNSWFV